jgi:hypothetical protein
MARPKNPTETVRLNLDLTLSTRERLERLQKATGARSMTEAISWALAVYEKLVSLEGAGDELVIRKPDKSEKTLLLIPPGT